MSTKTHDITLVILMDGNGTYAIGNDEDNAREQWDDQSEGTPVDGLRVIELTLTIPAPKTTVVKATLPEDDQEPITLNLTRAE